MEGKSSVSKIAKEDNSDNKVELKKPKFMEESIALSKAEIGTAVHLVMQKLDFKENYTIEKIEEMLENLEQKEILTNQQKKAIPVKKIYQFSQSKIFKEAEKAKETYKEQPFYINIPADEIWGQAPFSKAQEKENILVQGIIDLYYITANGEIVLVDYKTDYVPDEDENYLKEKYSKQLELYKMAIEQALNKKVSKIYIYSTYLGKEIEI